MCDTKADAIPAAAGAPEDEIEITPEMIEAGALAFYGPDWGLRRPFGFIGRCGLPLRLDRCSARWQLAVSIENTQLEGWSASFPTMTPSSASPAQS